MGGISDEKVMKPNTKPPPLGGSVLAFNGKNLSIYDANSGELRSRMPTVGIKRHPYSIIHIPYHLPYGVFPNRYSILVSQDGGYISCFEYDEENGWNENVNRQEEFDSSIFTMDLCSDYGSDSFFVVAGSEHKKVKLFKYSVESRELKNVGDFLQNEGYVYSSIFLKEKSHPLSSARKFMSSSHDSHVRVYDIEKKKLLWSRQLGTTRLNKTVYDPIKKVAYVVDRAGNTTILDPHNQKILKTLSLPGGIQLWSILHFEDSDTLVVGEHQYNSSDMRLFCWDLKNTYSPISSTKVKNCGAIYHMEKLKDNVFGICTGRDLIRKFENISLEEKGIIDVTDIENRRTNSTKAYCMNYIPKRGKFIDLEIVLSDLNERVSYILENSSSLCSDGIFLKDWDVYIPRFILL